MNRLNRIGVALTVFVALNSTAYASIWTDTAGWTQFAEDEGMAEGPGVGGQFFDAEKFFYRLTGSQLEIGLQTGFEGIKTDGSYVHTDGKTYYSGDLALNVNGTNYGVDFGFLTMNYDDDWSSAPNYDPALVDMGSGTGIDPAGIYGTPAWDNGVYKGHGISNPFALNGGTAVAGSNFSQSSGDVSPGSDSYYHIVSFDVSALGIDVSTTDLNVNAHWTMSCGNDNINGTFLQPSVPNVPEPGSLALLGLGLLAVNGVRRRGRKA